MSRAVRAAAVSLVMAGVGLVGCGDDESGAPTLTWYINPDSGGQEEIAGRCTEAAGGQYRIETSLLPREASDQREQLIRRLAANDDSIDIMSLDPPFIPEFAEAGFLADIPADVASRLTEGVVESAVEGARWEDELVTIPFWANTQLLWYRKSAAEQAGLDMTQPVTWDQLVEAAKGLDSALGVQGIRAEAYTVWINALITSAGGEVIENPEAPPDDVRLGLDTDAGREAAGVIEEIVDEGVAGPAFSTRNEDSAASLFESGGAMFMVNWPFVWPRGLGYVEAGTMDQQTLDDYGWALYPAVVEGAESRPPLGGINLGVSEFSKHRDLSLEAVECIVGAENQADYFVTNGNPAVLASVYDDPEVVEAFPMAPTIRDSLQQAAPRPQTPYYNEISVGLQQTWHSPGSVKPESTPEESAEFITAVLRKEALL